MALSHSYGGRLKSRHLPGVHLEFLIGCSGVPRGGVWGVQPPRNSEDIGGLLDRISKKNRRLDFRLQYTVFSYGCNLLNKGFF